MQEVTEPEVSKPLGPGSHDSPTPQVPPASQPLCDPCPVTAKLEMRCPVHGNLRTCEGAENLI